MSQDTLRLDCRRRVAFHICPACTSEIAFGFDRKGQPKICRRCRALDKLRVAHAEMLAVQEREGDRRG